MGLLFSPPWIEMLWPAIFILKGWWCCGFWGFRLVKGFWELNDCSVRWKGIE
jgi:hypothetical protein